MFKKRRIFMKLLTCETNSSVVMKQRLGAARGHECHRIVHNQRDDVGHVFERRCGRRTRKETRKRIDASGCIARHTRRRCKHIDATQIKENWRRLWRGHAGLLAARHGACRPVRVEYQAEIQRICFLYKILIRANETAGL